MNKDQILRKLNSIFCAVLAEPGLKISPTTRQDDLKGWDSLNHINIVISVEKEFGLKFKLTEIQRLKDIEGFVVLIQEKVT